MEEKKVKFRERQKERSQTIYLKKAQDLHDSGIWCQYEVFDRHHPNRNIGRKDNKCKRIPLFDKTTNQYELFCERHDPNKERKYQKPNLEKKPLLLVIEELNQVKQKVSSISEIVNREDFQTKYLYFKFLLSQSTKPIYISRIDQIKYLTYSEQLQLYREQYEKKMQLKEKQKQLRKEYFEKQQSIKKTQKIFSKNIVPKTTKEDVPKEEEMKVEEQKEPIFGEETKMNEKESMKQDVMQKLNYYFVEQKNNAQSLLQIVNGDDQKIAEDFLKNIPKNIPKMDINDELIEKYNEIFNQKEFKEKSNKLNEAYQRNLQQPVRIYLRINVPDPKKLQKEEDEKKYIIPYTLEKKKDGARIIYKNKSYGPFFSIFPHTMSRGNKDIYSLPSLSSSTIPPVNQPMKSIFDLLVAGYNVTLCCYGFSGTGKTFTLFGGDFILDGNIKETVDGIIQLGLEDLEASISTKIYSVFELYGKITSIKKNELKSNLNLFQYFGKKDIQTIFKKTIPTNIIQKITLNSFEKNTKIAFTKKNFDLLYQEIREIRLEKNRIKKTPNNPDSSRGHLFFLIKFKKRISEQQSNTCYFTLIDMAGAEDPEAIANIYFNLTEDNTFSTLLTAMLSTPEQVPWIRASLFPVFKKENKEENTIEIKKAIDTIQEGFFINDSIHSLTYFLLDHKKSLSKQKYIVSNVDQSRYYKGNGENYNRNQYIYDPTGKLPTLKLSISMYEILEALRQLGGSKEYSELGDKKVITKKIYNDGRESDQTNKESFNIKNMKCQYLLLVLLKGDYDILPNGQIDNKKEVEREKARKNTLEFANQFSNNPS